MKKYFFSLLLISAVNVVNAQAGEINLTCQWIESFDIGNELSAPKPLQELQVKISDGIVTTSHSEMATFENQFYFVTASRTLSFDRILQDGQHLFSYRAENLFQWRRKVYIPETLVTGFSESGVIVVRIDNPLKQGTENKFSCEVNPPN